MISEKNAGEVMVEFKACVYQGLEVTRNPGEGQGRPGVCWQYTKVRPSPSPRVRKETESPRRCNIDQDIMTTNAEYEWSPSILKGGLKQTQGMPTTCQCAPGNKK